MVNLDDFKTYFDSTYVDYHFGTITLIYEDSHNNNCLEGWHNRLRRIGIEVPPTHSKVNGCLQEKAGCQ